ncbi:MRN complex-interacting protein isoform X4 [Xiphophorus couchianus]|uniref:MRN complex-interacting protein isoform X4 n=1 Tax=Xiphophorus couchianus TaxID=32473 RepID=UPI0010170339|nr:MRN complex-interacting protein isoform X4 [Xiphophorus couchianus]
MELQAVWREAVTAEGIRPWIWSRLPAPRPEAERHEGSQDGGAGGPRLVAMVRPAQVSRWSKYLDTPEEEEEESEEEGLEGRNHLHGNQTISRKRHRPEELGGGRGDEGCPPVQLKRTAVTSSVTSSAAPSGSGSRWGQFLSADSWGAEHPLSGQSQQADTAAAKPRPQLPVSSMFDSGEDFNFDEDFLTF